MNTPDDADDAVRKAFYLAKMESRPVMMSAPMDIQQKAFEDDDEAYKPSSALIPPRAVRPDPEALKQAADIVAGAKQPVILVGRGARWSGAGEAVLKLAKRTGALVASCQENSIGGDIEPKLAKCFIKQAKTARAVITETVVPKK